MDSFDLERIRVYRHKIFHGVSLSEDQKLDFDDLRQRLSDETARKVLAEEREVQRKQAEEARAAQRELFQQQRELLLLSRRTNVLDLPALQDYKKLPRVVPAPTTARALSPATSCLSFSSSPLNSTSTSLSATIESLKLAPVLDERHVTVCPSPSLMRGLSRIPSVGDLYSSPNRTPTAAARAQTLALQKAYQDGALLKEKLEREFCQQKLEQRRAATLQRNLTEHFLGRGSGRGGKRGGGGGGGGGMGMGMDVDAAIKRSISVPLSQPATAPVAASSNRPLDLDLALAISSKSAGDGVNLTTTGQQAQGKMRIHHAAPMKSLEIKPFDPQPHLQSGASAARLAPTGTGGDAGSSSGPGAVYIETFDVLLCDIKGPLGKSSGGLRRYFKKLLDNFVTTGCIYRTVNKIGICVHGTVEALDMVKKVLDHAAKRPVSPLQGGVEAISWQYRATGRTLRHGSWGKHLATRLCENAQGGKYSPKAAGEKA